MRVVNWGAEERVDVPDKQAEGWLVVGEFRRLLRSLFLAGGTTGIVRGFRVEAAPVPNTTVIVKLDPGGGGALSAALGAENTGTVEYGQLVGERGQEGIEGNSSYAIDFTPQIAGTYHVEMRFSYVDGASDNRAFWNNATEVEFIAAQNTRVLPTLTFQIVSSLTGAEWIPLATVAWDGATVDPGDITVDRRNLVFEGSQPWTQTTQEGAGALPDFSRSDARALNTTDEVYTALKKLGRQIQDLKGPDESGVWSFHRRPIRPMDPGNLLSALRTKSIGSMDTLEYTIGDGTTTWGDFSGTNALQLCLSHIVASQANLPTRIRIRLKSRQTGLTPYLTGAATPIWTLTSELAFTTTKHIEIVGDCSKADQYNRVPVAWTHTLGPYFNFTGATGGSLTLRNIACHNVPTQEIFRSLTTPLCLYNSMLCAVTGTYVARTHVPLLKWEDSEVYGSIQFSSSATLQDTDGFSVKRCRFGQRTCWGTSIDGYFRFWGEATFADDPTLASWFANQGSFEACEFLYSSNAGAATSARAACMDLRGTAQIDFHSCDLSVPVDSNGVLLGTAGSVALGFSTSCSLQFINCRGSATTPVNANHDVSAGYNGALGTGWLFFGENDPNVIGTGVAEFDPDRCTMHNIKIDNLRCLSMPTLDSGVIYFRGMFSSVEIVNSRFNSAKFPNITYGGTPSISCVRLENTANIGGAKDPGQSLIDHCEFGRIEWVASNALVKHVQLKGSHRGFRVERSLFELTDLEGNDNSADYNSLAYCGIGIQLDGGAGHTKIDNCQFRFFDTPTTRKAAIWGGSHNSNVTVDIDNCYAESTSYLLLIERPGLAVPGIWRLGMRGNRLNKSGGNDRMFMKGTELTSSSRVMMVGNQVIIPSGGVTLVADVGDAQTVCIANDFSTTGQVQALTDYPVGLLQTPNMNIHSGMPAAQNSDNYRYRTPISRIVMIPLSFSGNIASWASTGGGLLSLSASGIVEIPIPTLRSGSFITRVRVAYDNNGVPGTPPSFDLIRKVGDKSGTPGIGSLNVERSDTDGVAGTTSNTAQTMDSGVFVSTTCAMATQEWFVRLTGSNNASGDAVYWIEVTITDVGPQNG